eukprot:gene16005-21719_t
MLILAITMIWNSGYPKEPQLGYCSISPIRNAVQNDDADQQTSGSTSRDMGSEGCVLVEGCPVSNHRSNSAGVPDGLSDCSKCTLSCSGCRTTSYSAAYDANSCGYDSVSYTRPHRDITIVNAMRSWMHLGSISNSDLGLDKCYNNQ